MSSLNAIASRLILVSRGNVVQAFHNATKNNTLCKSLEQHIMKGLSFNDGGENAVRITLNEMTDEGINMVRHYINEKLEGMKV